MDATPRVDSRDFRPVARAKRSREERTLTAAAGWRLPR
jgi:hypothetical protein